MIGTGLGKILSGIAITAMITGAGIGFDRMININKIDSTTAIIQKAEQQIDEIGKQNDSDKGTVQKLIDYVKGLEKQIDDTNKKLDDLDREASKLNSMLK
jgi:peptidoglycan hydrolase CwlO-like protein